MTVRLSALGGSNNWIGSEVLTSSDLNDTISFVVSGAGSIWYRKDNFLISGTNPGILLVSGGYVGIDTVSPLKNVQVNSFGISQEATLRLVGTNSAGVNSQAVDIVSSGTTGAGTNSNLIFRTRNGAGTITDNLILTSSGNIGLDNNTPRVLFEMNASGNRNDTDARFYLNSQEGDTYAMYYTPDVGVQISSYRSSDARRLPLIFQSAGGILGIGVTPTYKLDVSDATANGRTINAVQTGTTGTERAGVFQSTGVASVNEGIYVDSSNAATNVGIHIAGPVSGTNNYALQSTAASQSYFTGVLGIGTSAPAYQLQLSTDSAGKPGIGGLWTVVSDERLKENIELADLDRCYEIVKEVPLKRFTWKEEAYTDEQVKDRNNIGFIAQDVQTVFPKAVNIKPFTLTNGSIIDDCLDLNNGQINMAMYGALQKSMQIIENLQKRIEVLESK